MQTFNFNAMVSQSNQLKQIPIDMLVSYHNHKFQLYSGERLDDMVQSIKQNGVLTPIIVRPFEDKYEILAGHNRVNASKIAGLTTVPGVVKENLSDDEAEMYVVETNLLQRGFDDLKITEQATVIAMRHKQMFSEQKRAEIINELNMINNNSSVGNSKLQQVGNEYGLGKTSVARLIRIDTLIDELKVFIDEGIIAVRTGVELSYLFKSEQTEVASLVEDYGLKLVTAIKLRQLSASHKLNDEQIEAVMSGKSTNVSNTQDKLYRIKVRKEIISEYFDEDVKADEVEDVIEKALKMYFESVH